MKPPHLLRVPEAPEAYESLIQGISAAGMRCGWLEFSEAEAPEDLARAAELGVLRAVAVGHSGSLVVKPRRGAPVLKDLLREHFRGCVLVLIRGAVAAPELAYREGAWRLSFSDGSYRAFPLENLIAALRRPSPWQPS